MQLPAAENPTWLEQAGIYWLIYKVLLAVQGWCRWVLMTLRTGPPVFRLCHPAHRHLLLMLAWFWWSATTADITFPCTAGRRGKLKGEKVFAFQKGHTPRNPSPSHWPAPCHLATFSRKANCWVKTVRLARKIGCYRGSSVCHRGTKVTVSQCEKLGNYTAHCQKRAHFQTLCRSKGT